MKNGRHLTTIALVALLLLLGGAVLAVVPKNSIRGSGRGEEGVVEGKSGGWGRGWRSLTIESEPSRRARGCARRPGDVCSRPTGEAPPFAGLAGEWVAA